MKNFARPLFILFLLLLSKSTFAATLTIDTFGELTGATDVNVNGAFYDVAFVDGDCITLFSGCDALSDFTFQSIAEGVDASQALFDQVLLDIVGLDSYDTDPEKLIGCTNSGLCRILTPYGFTSEGNVAGASADNDAIEAGDIITPNIGISASLDLTGVTLANYAVWTAQPTSVPLPASGLLLGLSLISTLMIRKISR